jgi:hypothetical protein
MMRVLFGGRECYGCESEQFGISLKGGVCFGVTTEGRRCQRSNDFAMLFGFVSSKRIFCRCF